MTVFILGLIVFFAPHLFTAFARGARARLIGRIGEMPYKGLYSLVSAAGLALIVWGWRGADRTVLYVAPFALVYVAYALTFAGFVLLVSAYAPKGRIARAVRHPMLAGVGLWALAHLLVNGDVRSLLLFGAFLVYVILDRVAVGARGEAPPAPGPVRNDLIAIGAGAAVWAAVLFWLHPWLSGVALY